MFKLKIIFSVLSAKEKRQLVQLMILNMFISVADIAALAFLLLVINFYITPSAVASFNFLPAWMRNPDSIALVAIFFLLFGIKNLAGYFIAKAQNKFTSRVAIRISQNNLAKYQNATFEEFVNVDSSVQIRKIAFQPFEFSQYILLGVQEIIVQLFLIVITILAIILFRAKLFPLLLVVLLPPVIVVFYIIKKRMTIAKKNLIVHNERSYQYLLDALKGYVESNIYQRNNFFLKRFIKYRQQFSTHLFNSNSLQNLPGRVIEIFAVLGLFILIVIAKWTGNDNGILITIGAFMAAAYKIIPGIVKVINLAGQVKAHEFSIDDLMPAAELTETHPAGNPVVAIQSVELKNISFHYATQSVLKDLSFTLKRGDFLAISGISGKGKTTILNLLLGFLKPVSGEVKINERVVNHYELKQYWPSVSYVRQQNFLIHDTILRNITLEETDHDKERLELALKMSGLDHVIEIFPEKLEKIITENGKNISGGQRQRIAIARALYKNFDLLILDEPFNELDKESQCCLLEIFKKIAANGKMVVLITHDTGSSSFANKIITLNEGR